MSFFPDRSGQSTVLDDSTRRIIFRGTEVNGPNLSARVVKYLQNPLTDHKVINERLDTIEDLVEDNTLLQELDNFYNLVGAVQHIGIFSDVSRFIRYREHGWDLEKERNSIVQTVKSIANMSLDISTQIDLTEFRSNRLATLCQQYNAIMGEQADLPFMQIFEYFRELHEQITQLSESQKPKKAEEPEEAPRWRLFGRVSEEKVYITDEQLEALLDPEKINAIGQVIDHANSTISPFKVFIDLAKRAWNLGYVRPEIVPKEENCLIIRKGRYEMEKVHPRIPNDTILGDTVLVEVEEGTNRGGKTFDLLKVLYVASMALCGSFVPAEFARVSVRDRIIMKLKGQGGVISAFQRDSRNVIAIMPPPDEYWLCALDETYTSSERDGGKKLTEATLKAYADQGNSLLIISAHYPGLYEMLANDPRIKFTHFSHEKIPLEAIPGKFRLVFPHIKQDGPIGRDDLRYPIDVAEDLRFQNKILMYAEERFGILAERF